MGIPSNIQSIRAQSIVARDYEAMSQAAAHEIETLLSSTAGCCLALATGDTPRRCYEILSKKSQQKKLSWKNACCFALDEYLNEHKNERIVNQDANSSKVTLGHFLEERLYKNTDLSKEACFSPSQFNDYDSFIRQKGGWDVCLLGIGTNGHIAFNEPPTPLLSFTHCIWLSDETRAANARYYAPNVTVPFKALTVGISTVLASRKIVLLASGSRKKDILHRAFSGRPNVSLPASFLLLHDNLLVITDFDW